MGTEEKLCQNCNKTIYFHFGGNHHCDNGFGGPDPNRHFTPSPEPVAESEGNAVRLQNFLDGSINTLHYSGYMVLSKGLIEFKKWNSAEVSRLTSENERLRDALKQAMPYARDQFCPIELQERVNALLSPKSR